MEKIAFELYNCQENNLASETKLYNLLVEMGKLLKLKIVTFPTVVPYFQGKNKQDDGISLCFFYKFNKKIGFCTLHSFHKRKIVYFDFYNVTNEDLTLKIQTFLIHSFNPGQCIVPDGIVEATGWGKQVTFSSHIKNLSVDAAVDLLYKIVNEIDMTLITNPMIVKSDKCWAVCVLIAESHIFVSYSKENLYINIFSCKHFNEQDVIRVLEDIGAIDISVLDLQVRGVKHNRSLAHALKHQEILEIKSSLLCYGLALDKKLETKILNEKPYFSEKGFVHAVNINIQGHNTCVSTAENFSKKSQFSLNYNSFEKEYFIKNDKYEYIPIHIFDDLPTTGTVIDKIAKPHSLTCVSMWPSLKCCFASDKNKKCKFCSIQEDDYDIIPAADVIEGIKKLFENTYEYSLNIGGGLIRIQTL